MNIEKYLRLKHSLTKEQKKLLIELLDESGLWEIEQYNKGFENGKKQWLKIAIKNILGQL